MGLKISAGDIRWWFWAVTLAFIIAAVAGFGRSRRNGNR